MHRASTTQAAALHGGPVHGMEALARRGPNRFGQATHGRHGDARTRKPWTGSAWLARRSKACRGSESYGRHGMVSLREEGHRWRGLDRMGGAPLASLGGRGTALQAWSAWPGTAWSARLAWCGPVCIGSGGTAGTARPGSTRQGMAWFGWLGNTWSRWQGLAWPEWHGVTRSGLAALARPGMTWLGEAGQARQGLAGCGSVRFGTAGTARHGEVIHRLASLARRCRHGLPRHDLNRYGRQGTGSHDSA